MDDTITYSSERAGFAKNITTGEYEKINTTKNISYDNIYDETVEKAIKRNRRSKNGPIYDINDIVIRSRSITITRTCSDWRDIES